MAATITGFVAFSNFMRQLGSGQVDLTSANTFRCILHHSGANLSSDTQLSTLTSIAGTTNGAEGSASRALANVAHSAISAAPISSFSWNSDALVWTASATMTVKFAVFYKSLTANSGLPMGYVQLVANDTEITAGQTVTLTPNPRWFTFSAG